MDKESAEKELAYIKTVMEDSKRFAIDNGIGFITWGLLALAGIIFNTLTGYFDWQINTLYAWIIIMSAGLIYTFTGMKRLCSGSRVKTYSSRILGAVWIGCLLAVLLIFIIPFVSPNVPGKALTSFIIIIIGIGYFISGFIYSYKWITVNGCIWWLGAFLSLYFKFPYSSLIILSCLLLFFQIIPGIILYNKWKKELIKGE